MKTPHMRNEKDAGPRGFSRWIHPAPQKYLMACCDCGLVHEMQFRAFEILRHRKDGSYVGTVLPLSKYRVRFRARRAARHTTNWRKRMKK